MKLYLVFDQSEEVENPIQRLKRSLYNYSSIEYIKSFDCYKKLLENTTYVGLAQVAFTCFSATCEFIYKIPQKEQINYIEKVEKSGKPDTLYPKYPIVIIPSNTISSELELNIIYTLKAEIIHHKNKRILFDFRDLGYEGINHYECLHKVLKDKAYLDSDLEIMIF